MCTEESFHQGLAQLLAGKWLPSLRPPDLGLTVILSSHTLPWALVRPLPHLQPGMHGRGCEVLGRTCLPCCGWGCRGMACHFPEQGLYWGLSCGSTERLLVCWRGVCCLGACGLPRSLRAVVCEHGAACWPPYHPSGLRNQAHPASCFGTISAPSGATNGVIGCQRPPRTQALPNTQRLCLP